MNCYEDLSVVIILDNDAYFSKSKRKKEKRTVKYDL